MSEHEYRVPGGCHCSVPALCAGSSWMERAEKAEARLAEAEGLMNFAVDSWEYCMNLANVPADAPARKRLADTRAFLEAK